MTHLSAPALLFVVLALFTAAPAAASPDDVVQDCAEDGYVETGEYSNSELREGKKRIPSDLDAYSDCGAQIDQELAARAGAGANTADNDREGFPGGDGVGGSGSAGGSGQDLDRDGDGAVSDEERAAATESKRQMARAETESLLGDRKVDPGTAGVFDKADTANGLSLPALLALIALMLLLAGAALMAVRRRHPQFLAGTLGRVPFPRGLGSGSLRRRR